MPDFDFSDGLSEDWVSQRGSVASAAGRPSVAVLKADSSRSSSCPDGSVMQASNPPVPALAERSPSQLNAQRKDASSPEGTVQRRASEMPEGFRWKKENMRNATKIPAPQDLFSSIRLEKMFKPPTLKSQTRAPRPGRNTLARPKEAEDMPSSPPILHPTSSAGVPKAKDRRASNLALCSETPHSAGLSSIREAPEVIEISEGSVTRSDKGSAQQCSRDPSSARQQPIVPAHQKARVFSGRTNESFSAVDLDTLQASIKAATKTFHTKRDSRGATEQERPSSQLSDHGVDYGSEPQKQRRHPSRGSVLDSTTHSQTEEDSSLHQAIKRTSGFVTLRRGGYSSDDSFRRRPLSPSSFQQYSTPTLPQMPRKASRLSRVTEKDELPPTTPAAQQVSPERPRSSGSPLKLFDQHDTFTKDHLTRRISQFQIGDSVASSDEIEVDGQPVDLPPEDEGFEGDWLDEDEDLDGENSADEVQVEGKAEKEELEERPAAPRKSNDWRRSSGFGNGALNAYSFTQRCTTEQIQERVKQDRRSSPSRRVSTAYSRSRRASDRRARSTSHQLLADRSKKRQRDSAVIKIGKRQQRSPQKDSDAKRQRTASTVLSSSDGTCVRATGSRTPTIDSLAGKKRRDARYDDPSAPVDPEVLAARTMLRPKLPSGHSRSSSHTTVRLADQQPKPQAQSTTIIRPVEPPQSVSTHQVEVTHENAPIAFRKKSVTTADYFMEAQQVMQNLRQRIQPLSLANRSKSSPDVYCAIEETAEASSRPPTRERSTPVQASEELESVVVHQRRNFEDSSGLGLTLGSSAQGQRRHSDGSMGVDLPKSDPPNIRIVGKPAGEDQIKQHDSQKSTSSGGQSTKSAPTGLSASSGTRTVIGPEKVSHLICENVGRMTFDPAKHRWVKRSASEKGADQASSDPSEDDPLREIPDLLVDEDEEIITKSGKVASDSSGKESEQEVPENKMPAVAFSNSPCPPKGFDSVNVSFARLRPSTHKSFVASKSHGQLGQQAVGQATAATTMPLTSVPEMPPSPCDKKAPEVEAGKSLELRKAVFSPPPKVGSLQTEYAQDLQVQRQVSMSSRATQTQMSPAQIATTDEAFDEIIERGIDSENDGSLVRTYPPAESGYSIQYNAEEEPAPANQNMGLALASTAVVFTPPPKRANLLRLALSSSVAFNLSPLPTFTVNQADESLNLDLDYVAKRKGLSSTSEVDGKFSLAVQKLVATITDVEPHEPFWEHIRKLSLANKELFTLHMLDDFCPRVESLDVDGNELGQLNGAPAGLRMLSVRENCLSDMTAWGHLWNLQYLDVSGNQITSLKAFSSLIHLRELVAEDNRIQSLKGISQLDGLLKLNAARNSLEALDLGNSSLSRLEELDCEGNAIEQISGLDRLVALQRLKLRQNNIRSFPKGPAISRSVKYLDLSCNYLEHLDIANLARLETLHLDNNSVQTIDGIDSCPLLRLAWRSQRLEVPKDSPGVFYHACKDILSLALSNNKIPRFAPQSPMWSVSRLELARCGIQALDERLGVLIPNLRVLNLNHNAIKDLKPLVGVTSLEELYVAGNRVTRLRKTAGLLRSLGPKLCVFDCRDNPLTLGFYAPLSQTDPGRGIQASTNIENDMNPDDSLENHETQSLYRLAQGNDETDQEHLLTLDKSTAFRRRVYEILCQVAGPALETLDGLPIKRDKLQGEKVLIKWLVDLDVLQRPSDGASEDMGGTDADVDGHYEVHDPDSGIVIDGEI